MPIGIHECTSKVKLPPVELGMSLLVIQSAGMILTITYNSLSHKPRFFFQGRNGSFLTGEGL